MPALNQMSEQELIAELHCLADACERLNQEVARAAQRQRFSNDAQAIAWPLTTRGGCWPR